MKNSVSIKKSNSYNLFPLLTRNLTGSIFDIVMKREKPQFPKSIGDYVFKNEMEKIGSRKSYLLAIYENSKGKKALAKMRDAKIKGYHYYSLHNEANIYKILHRTLIRNKTSIPENLRNCYIPGIVGMKETKESLVILIEFVKGEIAENLEAERKSKLYFQMIDFLKFLDEKLLPEERKMIAVRKPLHYLSLYPLLVFKSIITYPNLAFDILKSIPVFIKNIPAIVKDSKLSLVHRDLHFMNILIHGKTANLIDLQQCVFTEPLHEIITTLRYYWEEDKVFKLIWKETLKRNKTRKNFNSLFQGYSVNSVTHGLTGKGWKGKIADGWINFLRFILKPDFLEAKI